LDTEFTMTHIGLMNNDRNHAILWEAISELCCENVEFKADFKLKLIGKVAAEVLESIHDFGVEDQVEMINYVPHERVLAYQQESQVLLLSVNNVPSAKGILTGKIFEYLNANRPIVALAPTDGDLAAILSQSNAGVCINFDDKSALKTSLLDLYTSYKNGTLKSTTTNVDQFHRKSLTKTLSELICTLVQDNKKYPS